MEHIKAWKREYKNWKGGHYSLEILKPYFKTGRLLDAGCGSGKYSLPLRVQGFDVVGVDVAPDALKLASKRSADRKIDISFTAANACTLPFREGSFDAVWCYGVLQHLLLKERELAISEFKRLLRKEGLLFIEVLGEEDMRYGGKEIEHGTFARKNGIIYHYFSKKELNELLKGFECRIIESRKEKQFNGKRYMRHMISAIARKL